MSREKQDDWKRTQIRVPTSFYEEIVDYAEEKNISINTAMLELMDRGIHSVDENTEKMVVGAKKVGIEEPERKELLDAIMNLQYMIGDHRKINEKLLLEIEALKKTK